MLIELIYVIFLTWGAQENLWLELFISSFSVNGLFFSSNLEYVLNSVAKSVVFMCSDS